MFRCRQHQKTAFFAQNWQKNPFFWPKTVFLGPKWSNVGPPTLFRGCWTHDDVFCKILERVIACLGAAITRKTHFLPKIGQKMPFFLPKTVFLGPEWSDVGPFTLF